MDDFPNHPKGLWGLAKDIGKSINVRIDISSRSKNKYSNVLWQERKQEG